MSKTIHVEYMYWVSIYSVISVSVLVYLRNLGVCDHKVDELYFCSLLGVYVHFIFSLHAICMQIL